MRAIVAAAREFVCGTQYGHPLPRIGANLPDLFRQTATYAQNLRGAKPADLPVQQPTKFELVVNPKAAKALGPTINRDFLLLADEVIE